MEVLKGRLHSPALISQYLQLLNKIYFIYLFLKIFCIFIYERHKKRKIEGVREGERGERV